MDHHAATILVVEDHHTTRTFLADNLSADGFDVLEAETVFDARHLLERSFPDLAIVDLGLPDGDGLELLERVREADRIAGRLDPDLPAARAVRARERARPAARLRPRLRRLPAQAVLVPRAERAGRRVAAAYAAPAGHRRACAIGSLELDPLSRQVWVRGEPVALSKKEYALLRALAADPTRVFTREELLRGVWGFRAMGTTRTLDSHAFRLRQKLNRAGDRFVVNVWGVGYRLVDGSLEP